LVRLIPHQRGNNPACCFDFGINQDFFRIKRKYLFQQHFENQYFNLFVHPDTAANEQTMFANLPITCVALPLKNFPYHQKR
jgi:hypothetical protein